MLSCTIKFELREFKDMVSLRRVLTGVLRMILITGIKYFLSSCHAPCPVQIASRGSPHLRLTTTYEIHLIVFISPTKTELSEVKHTIQNELPRKWQSLDLKEKMRLVSVSN